MDIYEISYNYEDIYGEYNTDYAYYAYYDNEMIYIHTDEENDENYASYFGGEGQCPMQNFLINKKTKIIEKYDSDHLGFIKTKNGYYFTKDNNSGCSLEWTKNVYTTNWKLLGTVLDYYPVDNQGNIYVIDGNDIVKYDTNGKELFRNSDYKEIGNGIIVDNILYIIVKDKNNVIYLLNLNDNYKVEIAKNDEKNFSLWPSIWISLTDNSTELIITYNGTNKTVFIYSFSTKKLVKVDNDIE